jgi:hypothetical protein
MLKRGSVTVFEGVIFTGALAGTGVGIHYGYNDQADSGIFFRLTMMSVMGVVGSFTGAFVAALSPVIVPSYIILKIATRKKKD